MIDGRRAGMVAVRALMLATALFVLGSSSARAEAQWRLEQPQPPATATGSTATPVGLGHVGDVEFWAPNRGVLITAGNGSTIPAGVWAYNGAGWHELANVCGATDGRVVWAGPDEFWTVSDGRPGQAANGLGAFPSLLDNTLCHFAGGAVQGSYATLGFRANSYQAMRAGACLAATDCWFAGERLPAPAPGSFHLHWDGASMTPEPNLLTSAVGSMQVFEGHLFEAPDLVPPTEQETLEEEEILHPYVLEEVLPGTNVNPFVRAHQLSTGGQILPEYAPGTLPQALGPFQLSSGSGELWAAAEARLEPPPGSEPGVLTVLRDAGGSWTQVLGPGTPETLTVTPAELGDKAVGGIAAEPGGEGAWLALDDPLDADRPSPTQIATVAHVSATGVVETVELPSEAERQAGIGGKGGALRISCPAPHDCWLTTTQGWLFHLAEEGERTLPQDTDASFNGPLISARPTDESLPVLAADAPPPDTSGEEAATTTPVAEKEPETALKLPVALITHLKSRVVKGTTLELSFHLAVKARVKLVAKRHKRVVASTPNRTLKAGKRKLLLKLDVHRWPTKLDLKTHALAPLPTTSTRSKNVESVSTSLRPWLGASLFGGPFSQLEASL